MVTDPISDLLTQIKNGYLGALTEVVLPWSRTKEAVAQVLVKEGYLTACAKKDHLLTLTLKYTGREAAVTDLKRVSKPGRRIYSQVKSIPKVLGGIGISVLSTPKGVISDKQAKKLNVGGEILAQVW